jgi:hypothetical protein
VTAGEVISRPENGSAEPPAGPPGLAEQAAHCVQTRDGVSTVLVMTTDRGEGELEPEAVNLNLSVWTPTPDEAAAYWALADQLAQATTTEAMREARRRIDDHFREMQHRHRDDPPRVSPNRAPDDASEAQLLERLRKQLRDWDEDPTSPPARHDPSSN